MTSFCCRFINLQEIVSVFSIFTVFFLFLANSYMLLKISSLTFDIDINGTMSIINYDPT